MSTTHVVKTGDFIRDGRGPTMVTTCTTGDESSEGSCGGTTTGADDGKAIPSYGLPLGGAGAVDIYVEAAAGGFGDGARLEAWGFNMFQRKLCRCPDFDVNLSPGLTKQMFAPRKIDARLGYLFMLPVNGGTGMTITLTVMPVRI